MTWIYRPIKLWAKFPSLSFHNNEDSHNSEAEQGFKEVSFFLCFLKLCYSMQPLMVDEADEATNL